MPRIVKITNERIMPGTALFNIRFEDHVAGPEAPDRPEGQVGDADIIAACFHWGEEYHFVPSAHQRRAAEAALAGGAHLLIGTHPHVLQPMEVSLASSDHGADARLVAWSLGNFVSFQRTLPRERSCVLAVEVEKTDEDEGARLVRVSVAPTRVVLVPSGGRRRAEVAYAGTEGSFNHAGLPPSELERTRKAGRRVLDFLGADGEPDENGFYSKVFAYAKNKKYSKVKILCDET